MSPTRPERDDPAWLVDGSATVSVTALAPFFRLVEEAGPDVVRCTLDRSAAVFARWGVDPGDISDVTLRLPHGLMIALLEEFTQILGDPSAPLRAGTKLRPGDYELLEYLCGSCSTLGESMACLGHYYPLLIAAEHEVCVEGDRAEARFRIAEGLEAPTSIHEFGLASNFAMASMHLQLEGAAMPIEVCFAHQAPPYAELFPQLFLAPVRFGCEHNAIVFPARMLAHPLRTADPVLHAVLTRLADQELQSLADLSVFPAKLRQAIEAELASGAALEAVAARLGISPSALRSRLRQHGTNYSNLLDRLRRDRARRALHQSQLSVSEVAHSLGFAHPPAFHRAFKRWFGVTPNAYRDAPNHHPTARFWRKG